MWCAQGPAETRPILGNSIVEQVVEYVLDRKACRPATVVLWFFTYAYFEMSFIMMDIAPPLYPPPNMAK
jgi:hypothetical protein